MDKNGVLHALYRKIGGSAGNKSSIEFVEKDLTQNRLSVESYTGLSDEEMKQYASEGMLTNMGLHVSNLLPKAGENLTLSGRVINNGVHASKEQKLYLYVNDMQTNNAVTVPAMASGMGTEFTFNYKVPNNYKGQPIKFSVKGNDGTVLTQETASGADFELESLDFKQLTYLDDESDKVTYAVTAVICNNGNDISEPATLTLSYLLNGKTDIIEDVYGKCDVPRIEPEDSKTVMFKINVPKKYLNENTLHLASVAGALYYNYDPDNVENQSMQATFSDYVQAENAPEAQTLTVPSKVKPAVGESKYTKIKVTPTESKAYSKIKMKSSDSTIVKAVGNGFIKGLRNGTCNITVTTANGLKKP